MLEKDLKTAVEDYLQIKQNQGELYFDRLNSGDFIEVRGNTRRRIKGCRKGTADYFILRSSGKWGVPRLLFIELKGDKGRQSKEQKEFQHLIECQGAMYSVVKSVEDLQGALSWV